jgi:hypothetical protein
MSPRPNSWLQRGKSSIQTRHLLIKSIIILRCAVCASKDLNVNTLQNRTVVNFRPARDAG